MGKNYLPFANRAIFSIDKTGEAVTAYARRPVEFGAMSIGVQGDSRAILQDLCIHVVTDEEEGAFTDPGEIGVRLGWVGKGYLTQRHMPLDVMQDGGYELYRSWTFPRPYRLFSKERLKVQLEGIAYGKAKKPTFWDAGATFNGVNVATQEPIILHDGLSLNPDEDGLSKHVLDGEFLRTPYDSDVDLYSLSFGNAPLLTSRDPDAANIAYQVEGPGRRNWFKYDSQTMALVGAAVWERMWWAAPFASLIKLGEEDGWYMHQGQTLLVDIRDWANVAATIVVTLRGSLEVEDDRI